MSERQPNMTLLANGVLNPHDAPDFLVGKSRKALLISASFQVFGIQHSDPGATAYKQLMFLLDGSGLNSFKSASSSRAAEEASVQDFAKTQVHPKNHSLNLNQIIAIGDDAFNESYVKSLLFRAQNMWPHDEIPHAYLLFVANDITRHKSGLVDIFWESRCKSFTGKATVNCRLSVPATHCDHAKPPYLVLVNVKAGSNNSLIWLGGYAQPIENSDNWIPVDSQNERDAVFAIKTSLAQQERQAIPCFAFKPVIGIPVEGVLYKPDFIVCKNDSMKFDNLVIETMGYKSTDYFEKKKILVSRLKKIGDVYQDLRFGSEAKYANVKLIEFIGSWFEKFDRRAFK